MTDSPPQPTADQQTQLNAALIAACRRNDADEAQRLLRAGADADAQDDMGERPLLDAAAQGHCSIIRLLAKHGANVNRSFYFDWEAVQVAVAEGQLEALKLLAELGADLSIEDAEGWTLLRIAADDSKKLEIIAWLIEQGVDVNRGDEEGYTPLHEAASLGYTDIVRLLLESGADVNALTSYPFREQCTPLDETDGISYCQEAASLLKSHGGKTAEELKRLKKSD